MNSIDISKPIEVHSVREEYDLLKTLTCKSCNTTGQITCVMQKLVFREGRPHDILECQCGFCSEKYEITFDISSFFGK